MRDKKIVRTRRSYEADFRQEVARMLTTGKSAREISEIFGIAEKRSAAPGCLSLEKIGNDEDKIKQQRSLSYGPKMSA